MCTEAEIRPREITPGAFTAPTSSGFELRFSVEMVDGVAKLTGDVEEVRSLLPPSSTTLSSFFV